MSPCYEELKSRAKRMRNNATFEERLLWSKLRKKQVLGIKFRRQHVLRPYIVDFFCFSERFVIEVDGDQHGFPDHEESDDRRDEHLREVHGVDILRVSARQVRQELDAVLDTIESRLKQRIEADAR